MSGRCSIIKFYNETELLFYRGETPSDLDAMVDSLQRLSQLIVDFPEIEEFDINPLRVQDKGNGVRVVDVRIGLR